MKKKAILIFDIGKTNKKYFLFDEHFAELESSYVQFPEIADDDGDPCDDLTAIRNWVMGVVNRIKWDERFEISFINISAYGATLVHLDNRGEPCTPLYNYLKELPQEIKELFIAKHGDINEWSKKTASPYLGMLNAGLQLFWIKYQKPALFQQIQTSVFLPQYLSYVLSGVLSTEYTSIGCHTGMWDFKKNDFHEWVYNEELTRLLPPLVAAHTRYEIPGVSIKACAGIHDSSAALVPFLQKSSQPFILLSTGTWSICLNPFNDDPLTIEELNADCLCYLQPGGKQVKASRFFLGDIFTKGEKLLAEFFEKPADYHHSVEFDNRLFEKSKGIQTNIFVKNNNNGSFYFEQQSLKDLTSLDNYEEAYHQLINELVGVQVEKINLVLGKAGINRIFIDGGFVRNSVFVQTLKEKLPGFIITSSDIALGSSLGAAMIAANESVNKIFSDKTPLQ